MDKKIYDQDAAPSSIPEQGMPPEDIEAKKELGRARKKLHDAFDTLFRAMMGGTYARIGEDGFSGDAASLYVLVSMKNKKGENVPELVKVGWGEFSKNTFESDRYPVFQNFPFDIYCISQNDSYFANETLRKDMIEHPEKYLSEHSIFVATHGTVEKSERIDHRIYRVHKNINAILYDDMLHTVRNQIILEYATSDEFAAFLKELPDDPVELGKYMNAIEKDVERAGPWNRETANEETKIKVRKKYLLHTLWGMGIQTVGIAVGDRKAAESVLELKKQFDFETNSFR